MDYFVLTMRVVALTHAPVAEGKVDKSNPARASRSLQQLGIELILACSSEARGRSERMSRPLQGRLLQDLGRANITDGDKTHRFLKEIFSVLNMRVAPALSQERLEPHLPLLPVAQRHFMYPGRAGSALRHKTPDLQIAKDRHRCHHVKSKAGVQPCPDRTLALFYGLGKRARMEHQGRGKGMPSSGSSTNSNTSVLSQHDMTSATTTFSLP